MQQVPYPRQQYPQGHYPQAQYPQAQYSQGQRPPQQAQTTQNQSTHYGPKIWDRYNSTASKVLGYIQIVIAISCIIFNAIGLRAQQGRPTRFIGYSQTEMGPNGAFYVGAGFWTSIFFLISGGLAVCAAKKKTTCMIVGCMVMAIISCVFAFCLLGTAAAAIGIENNGTFDCKDRDCEYVYYPDDGVHKTSIAMGTLMLVLSLLEIVVSILSSGFACVAVCCGSRTRSRWNAPGAMNMQYVGTPGQPQYMQQAPGPGQPMMQQGGYAPQPMAYNPNCPQPQQQQQQQQPEQQPHYAQQPGYPAQEHPTARDAAPPTYEDMVAQATGKQH